MTRQIAAIFAHPDDEVLGAGATLARLAGEGAEVRILILATGLESRGQTDPAAIEALRKQGRAAAEILGAASIEFADFPDNRMDTVALHDIIRRVEAFAETFDGDGPETIFTHHGGDLNIDHRLTHQGVLTAFRPLPGTGSRDIVACEVNSSTEWAAPPLAPFEPTVFVDVAATIDRKADALAAYEGELRDWPHPRSVEGIHALARTRGMQCGAAAAEAFALVRRVTR